MAEHPLELITSRRNPLVAHLRALHQPRGRREQGLLLLEGTHLLQEVLRLGLRPERIVATPSWLERHGRLLGSTAGPVQPVAEPVLAAAATTDSPDGVLLTLAAGALPSASGGGRFVLALDQLQDPGNLGTLLRTALAAGVDAVWLGGGADPWQPKVLRASAGAALAMPLRREADRGGLMPLLERAAAAGHQLVATLVENGKTPAGGGTVPYWQLDWTQPTVLLLGNEGAGL
ncbi:MAG: TrmH family RNA methyltransferase, partial [Vulcanococcus sp.]